jgi:hypothetical protein
MIPTSLRTALLVTLLALAALAASRDYYPIATGTSWTYSSGETQTLSGPRDFHGVSVMVLTHYLDGMAVSEDYLVFGEGVFSYGTASGGQVVRFEPPLVVYPPAPIEIGDSWQSTTQLGGMTLTLQSEVLGLRGVQTAAGRFNALQIRQRTLTSTGGSTVLDLFFVPGVGVVRFVTQDGTTIDLIEFRL